MPITEEQRERAATLVRQGMGRNAIAREIGVSSRTISNVAAANGLTFDRRQAKAATEAMVADARVRRAALGDALLGDLEQVRVRILQAQTARELQAIGQGLDALMRSYVNLAKVDGPEDPHGAARARSMVGGLLQLITTEAAKLPPMNPTMS